MARGTGTAMVVAAAFLCMLVIQTEMAQPTVYLVGDDNGWTFNVTSWTKGKHFRAGDFLVFFYIPAHNVVPVSKAEYDSCTRLNGRGGTVYQSGQDSIKLAKGQHYFICSYALHCFNGMKIAVKAV